MTMWAIAAEATQKFILDKGKAIVEADKKKDADAVAAVVSDNDAAVMTMIPN